MNKAQRVLEMLCTIYEYEPENIPDITSDDVTIHTVQDTKYNCATCGMEINTGMPHADKIQCPGCGHMIDDIGGSPLSGLRQRRLDYYRED